MNVLSTNPDYWRDEQLQHWLSIEDEYQDYQEPCVCEMCGDVIPLGDERDLSQKIVVCESCILQEMAENELERGAAMSNMLKSFR